MTTFAQLQDEILQVLQGYGLSQPRSSYLTSGVDASELTWTLNDVSGFSQGLAEIGSELVFIEEVDRSAGTITISPDGRGYYGTTAAAHSANARVTFAPVWSRQRVKSAINDTIVSVYPTLWGVDQAQFAFTPSVSTYSLPAEVEKVLAVTADVNGPSLEQQIIRRFHLSPIAPSDDWATETTLTLYEPAAPGKTVTVTYAKQPSTLSSDSDELTTSGLRETAKLAIVYGACAQLLSFVDAARLPVDTAEAAEFAETNQLGMASRISGQLRLQHELEVEKERKRLRANTPVTIIQRKR